MATPNASRKMRRTRDAASSENLSLSGLELYGEQGDSGAALEAFRCGSGKESVAARYNVVLLEHLHAFRSTPVDAFLQKLQDYEAPVQAKKDDPFMSPRKIKRNEFIMIYNRALLLHAAGKNQECAALLWEKIQPMVQNKESPWEEMALVTSRMALLLLDCVLAVVTVGRRNAQSAGLATIAQRTFGIESVTQITDWIESAIVSNKSSSKADPQLKFLLPVYKSRLVLAEVHAGKPLDANVRAARKEMKTAMEVFQNKLRPAFGGPGETASVVSSANSEENMSSAGLSTRFLEVPSHSATTSSAAAAAASSPPTPAGSIVLQKLNRSALCLKAHLEQLKGNTKKSLILCSEAQTATTIPDPDYEAIHYNNLAVVYETTDRRHLALHALAKSIRANPRNDTNDTLSQKQPIIGDLFHTDGTARPDPTLSILHNAALCALRAQNYESAYECMSACIAHSPVFGNHPFCWIRLAEACIGMHSRQPGNAIKKISAVTGADGMPQSLLIDKALFREDLGVVKETFQGPLGSPEDLLQVQRNPLLRARAALEHALQHADELEWSALISVRLSLAYLYLSFHDYHLALNMARAVIKDTDSPDINNNITHQNNGVGDSTVARIQWKKQAATARMYAAEASCALGELTDAMKFLVGDGKDDAFDRLASDLGGVTMETASASVKGKHRLARAQAAVRSSACAVTAAMGNPAAKQLGNSANAMEDVYSSDRERSSARRALIYTLLREGHQSSALNMLLSLR